MAGTLKFKLNLKIPADAQEGKKWAIELLTQKLIEQERTLVWLYKKVGMKIPSTITGILRHSGQALQGLSTALPSGELSAIAMGHEGFASKAYWEAISAALPEAHKFKGRSRQPAKDTFNATLNYLYGMLYNVVERAALGKGLDPQLGVLHADTYGHPTLVYDLIEPFRPWADRLLCGLCLDGLLLPEHTQPKDPDGVWLSPSGRRMVIPAFNDWLRSTHDTGELRMPVQSHIFRMADLLANQLLTPNL